jgi:hypothetical protein
LSDNSDNFAIKTLAAETMREHLHESAAQSQRVPGVYHEQNETQMADAGV